MASVGACQLRPSLKILCNLLLPKEPKKLRYGRIFTYRPRRSQKKHLCEVLVILCDCSANILLVLGANGPYVFLMRFNPATQDTPSREILPEPCCEGMRSAISTQKRCSHNYDGLQPLKRNANIERCARHLWACQRPRGLARNRTMLPCEYTTLLH